MTANAAPLLHASGEITLLDCHPEGRPGFAGPKDLNRKSLLCLSHFAHCSLLFTLLFMFAALFLAKASEAIPLQSTEKPDWCKPLPRPEYKSLQRLLPNDPWFEVYKVSPGVFAIYEPHQAEETISYLIVGTKQALLFDTGMGIGNIRKVVSQLTSRPVVVLNSHTHDDHVGGNWQFPFIFGMDTDFTRTNALAPNLKLVLGAHNIPEADPSVLPRLVTVFESVRAGKVPPQKSDGGKTLYAVDGISFLLKTGTVAAR